MSLSSRPIILTGDRTTGPLHIGHFVGSLRSRIELQHTHQQYVLLADAQALTDNAHDVDKVRSNVIEVALDYLAVGIDPEISSICVQSALPALAELSMLYLNFVSVARLERNPTIKEEISARGFGRDIPAGFLCYPASQAADITAFKATVVPVGTDQIPMIEQTNELVRRLNRQIGYHLLPEANALTSQVGRLPGVDGIAKMSKSQGNSILLSSTDEEIEAAVQRIYTDPNHLRVSDPGRVDGNVVFTYLDAFDAETETVKDLKAHYTRGGLGDSFLKRRLSDVIKATIGPIRDRRAVLSRDPDTIMDILRHGTNLAREITERTKVEIMTGLGLFRL